MKKIIQEFEALGALALLGVILLALLIIMPLSWIGSKIGLYDPIYQKWGKDNG